MNTQRLILTIALSLACSLMSVVMVSSAIAAGEGATHDMTPDLDDEASLQRGMKLFVNYCMGCHSLEYQRFSRASEDLGIPEGMMVDNLMFSSQLGFNDQMHRAMREDDAEAWFGVAPPDLTLEARLRGADWIYSYLLGFYRDSERPFGVNNVVFPAVGMPNVLEELQGVQELTCTEEEREHAQGGECSTLSVVSPGSMSTQDFEAAMFDLTNFLVYVGEPSRLQARSLGPKVLIFLLVFIVITWLLKREYWRDVH